jgi:hypothetical protein
VASKDILLGCVMKKITVLSEENKNTSTYSGSKEKREERIRKRLSSL